MKVLSYCTYMLCGILASYYHANQIWVTVLGVFMAFDTITGALKGWKLHKFSTSEMKWGIISKILVFCIPPMLYLLFNAANWAGAKDSLATIALSLLAVAELISSIQNVYTVRTGVAITEQDAVSQVISWILKKLRMTLDVQEKE